MYTISLECGVPNWRFVIKCDNEVISVKLLSVYANFCCNSQYVSCEEERCMTIITGAKYFKIWYADNAYQTETLSFSELIYHTYTLLERSVVSHCTKIGMTMLHGGAISLNGKALAFIAPSYTGKSTLLAHLGASKYDIVSDDCVIIESKTKSIYTYPHPIRIRNRLVLEAFPTISCYRWENFYDFTTREMQNLIISNKKMSHGNSLVGILYIKRSNANNFTKITMANNYRNMIFNLKHTANIELSKQNCIPIARDIPGYLLEYNSLEAAENCVSDLFINH